MKVFLKTVPFFAGGTRRFQGRRSLPAPGKIALEDRVPVSTQAAFGKILDEIAASRDELADRIVTTSPDVTVSTNLGPWVNRRGLFARNSARRHLPR